MLRRTYAYWKLDAYMQYYINKDHTCFDLHVRKSHHGTDFCPSGSVWLVLGKKRKFIKRIAKVNAVKGPGGKVKKN